MYNLLSLFFSTQVNSLQFIQAVVCLLLYIDEQCSMVWLSHDLFKQSPVEGHLAGFQCLAVVDEAARNNSMHRLLCEPKSSCL